MNRCANGAGGRRTRPCPTCHAHILLGHAPWGAIWLEPYPDPEGELLVDPLAAGLKVLGPREKRSGITKPWARHRCTTRPVRRPQPPAEQLGLF